MTPGRRDEPPVTPAGVKDSERTQATDSKDENSPHPRGALALVRAWGDLVGDGGIDAILKSIYSARERDVGRPVDLDAC